MFNKVKVFNNKLSILILLFLITSSSGYHTAYAGGGMIGGSSCPTDIAFRERPVGQRQLSRAELTDIRTMNDSVFCKNNCSSVVERVARYLNTGKRELIKLPPLYELYNGDEFFEKGMPIKEIDAYLNRLESEGIAQGISVFRPRTTNIDALAADLLDAGPGTHALVGADMADTTKIHAFNLIVADGANGPEVMMVDGAVPPRYSTTTSELILAPDLGGRTYPNVIEAVRDVYKVPFRGAIAFSPPAP